MSFRIFALLALLVSANPRLAHADDPATRTAKLHFERGEKLFALGRFEALDEYAMDQFLAHDYEANGLQLAATADGHWTAGFRDSCNAGACTVFGRTFDENGAPLTTAAAAGTNAFAFSSTVTSQASTPALAASGNRDPALDDHRRPARSLGGRIAGRLCGRLG